MKLEKLNETTTRQEPRSKCTFYTPYECHLFTRVFNIVREIIKESLSQTLTATEDIAYVGYQKGEPAAVVRWKIDFATFWMCNFCVSECISVRQSAQSGGS